MSDFDQLSLKQVIDFGNKIGGQERAKRFMSGELVLVEKEHKVSVAGSANGGITYASGLNTAAFLADWAEFLDIFFAYTGDLSKVALPPITPGFNWGVAVVHGLSSQKAYDRMAKEVQSYKYWDNLDASIRKNDRNPGTNPYIVWCRDRIEADVEFRGLSANDLQEKKINTMTLLERELLGLWFYWKTKGHLDVKNVTLCAGSRSTDGDVPYVGFGGSGVYVSYYDPGNHGDNLRAREVVSLADAKAAA